MQRNSVRITAIVIDQCQIRQRNQMLNPEHGGLGQFAGKKDILTILIICQLFHKNLLHKFLSLKWHKIIVNQDCTVNMIFKSNATFRYICYHHALSRSGIFICISYRCLVFQINLNFKKSNSVYSFTDDQNFALEPHSTCGNILMNRNQDYNAETTKGTLIQSSP